jgi:archaellum component FlaC
MRSFPYKLLFICILAPPICYIFTLQGIEMSLKKKVEAQVNAVKIKNYQALYDGRYTVKEEINRNVGEYLLAHAFMNRIGVSTEISVRTRDGRILYPADLKEDKYEAAGVSSNSSMNYMDIATWNYKILNDDPAASVGISVRHNSWLSNSILLFYILLFLFIIQRSVRKSVSESEALDREKRQHIDKLTGMLKETENGLSDIRIKEDGYLQKIEELKKERENLSTDIDDLLGEMENLETGLAAQRDLREKREKEVHDLQNEIGELKERVENTKKKIKAIDTTRKRFKVLYKNLEFSERALEGFLSLSDEFQLKAEEIIHRLNEDRTTVSVKRKVFGKGGKLNVLEADFAYSGRIYFQADAESKTRVLGLGTKNTQDQDIAYLERTCKAIAAG